MILIDRSGIAAMIPHAGSMCLLDGVLRWDAESVLCLSHRYSGHDNPMRRRDGTLGVSCGIEIAAQAMAVHGRLAAGPGARPSRGYLASVRDVLLHTDRLDGSPGHLMIEATLLIGDMAGASYRFTLARHGIDLISGRATVLLEVPG
jgi:predicted hotdog family 3-hydroxylacyl-ACP dehydratase